MSYVIGGEGVHVGAAAEPLCDDYDEGQVILVVLHKLSHCVLRLVPREVVVCQCPVHLWLEVIL